MSDSKAAIGGQSNEVPLVDDDFSPLSGKPFFQTVLTKSHLKSLYHMVFPARLHQYLPPKFAPAIVTCRGKTWEMMFHGDSTTKRLDVVSWRAFANENNLKIGDALFWEIMESCEDKVNLKVQIIKGEFPFELAEKVNGKTEDTPIVLD